MIDPADPPEEQIRKQGRIIEALLRRAEREHDLGGSAYAAFQSAVTLQGQVLARTRDLERASSELETLRFDRERTQRMLSEALSAMEGGFALFADGRLQASNDLFVALLPDISASIRPGLTLERYLERAAGSTFVSDADGRARLRDAVDAASDLDMLTFVLGLTGDRWFQFSLQRTTSDSLIVLQTEITGIVQKNRLEKDALMDMQAHYLQAAFDNMSLGIGTFSRAGALLNHNGRFRDLLALPARLVRTGTRFSEILEHIRTNRLFSETDLTGINGWPRNLRREGRLRQRIRHKGGRVLDLHVHLLPDRGFLVDIADVTFEHRSTQLLEAEVEARTRELTDANLRLTEQSHEQSRVEHELRLAKERAEAADSSKTRFLAAASHDLLQPVSAAKLLISTLEEAARGGPLSSMAGRLRDSFNSIESLLHSLLDISRLEATGAALTPTAFCLGPLMESVTEDMAPLAARKGIRLDVVPSSIWVQSDPRYLLRSIQNLIVNAIQYTERGRVLCGCRRRGERVVLEVWDTGIGISHSDQARIFEEFTRAPNATGAAGMGLGLSIVERACRTFGHDLRVRSKPGVGSVFSIGMEVVGARHDLPRALPPPSPDHGDDLDVLALVVENDPDVLFATVGRLESWGVSVFGTASTAEALEVVRDTGIAPDIILADYQLDGNETGIEAIRAVRAATGERVPAIVITADRGAHLTEKGTRDGFVVLHKPVDPWRLRRSIVAGIGQPAPVRPAGEAADQSLQ